jgi:hypothetical protein
LWPYERNAPLHPGDLVPGGGALRCPNASTDCREGRGVEDQWPRQIGIAPSEDSFADAVAILACDAPWRPRPRPRPQPSVLLPQPRCGPWQQRMTSGRTTTLRCFEFGFRSTAWPPSPCARAPRPSLPASEEQRRSRDGRPPSGHSMVVRRRKGRPQRQPRPEARTMRTPEGSSLVLGVRSVRPGTDSHRAAANTR